MFADGSTVPEPSDAPDAVAVPTPRPFPTFADPSETLVLSSSSLDATFADDVVTAGVEPTLPVRAEPVLAFGVDVPPFAEPLGLVVTVVGAAALPPSPMPFPVAPVADAFVAVSSPSSVLVLEPDAAALASATAGAVEAFVPAVLALAIGSTVAGPTDAPEAPAELTPPPCPRLVEPTAACVLSSPSAELALALEVVTAGVWPIAGVVTLPVDALGVVTPPRAFAFGDAVTLVGAQSVPQSADAWLDSTPNNASAIVIAMA